MDFENPRDPHGLLTASPALTEALSAIAAAATASQGRLRLDPEEGKLGLLELRELNQRCDPVAMFSLDRLGWLDFLLDVHRVGGRWEGYLREVKQVEAVRAALTRLAGARKALEGTMADLGGAE